jgi:hypothetical protein
VVTVLTLVCVTIEPGSVLVNDIVSYDIKISVAVKHGLDSVFVTVTGGSLIVSISVT